MSLDAPEADVRLQHLQAWLEEIIGHRVDLRPASGDASTRRYFRLHDGVQSLIAMDAPPPHDCARFVRVDDLLREVGVHAPRIFAENPEGGFLLLEDLGRQTYLDALTPDNACSLFGDALQALLRWQAASQPGELPPYDEALLDRELRLFPEWYLERHLGLTLSARRKAVLEESFRRLKDAALAQPRVYVHRDYMPRNLMLSEPNPGVLDFQDAVYGPITYDVISLFRDAFVSWPEAFVERGLRRYWESARETRLPVHETFARFRRDADWMGMQRHLKIVGLFTRIALRDGKPRYLADVPRFFAYLREAAGRYPEFAELARLLREVQGQ